MRKWWSVSAVIVVALATGGCGGDSEVSVDDAWARTSPMMATAGAAYMQISSPDGDELLSASVDSSVAETVELHETVMAGGEGEEEGGMGGEMSMQQVASIPIPAGETVSLEPGGYHVMLLDLAEPLEVGATFELTLVFETAGEQTVTVEVREETP